jgi:hypothetical protein
LSPIFSVLVVVALPVGFALLAALALKPLNPILPFWTVFNVTLIAFGVGFGVTYGTYLWTMFVAHRPFNEASPIGTLGGLVLAGWMIRSGLKAERTRASKPTITELSLD